MERDPVSRSGTAGKFPASAAPSKAHRGLKPGHASSPRPARAEARVLSGVDETEVEVEVEVEPTGPDPGPDPDPIHGPDPDPIHGPGPDPTPGI